MKRSSLGGRSSERDRDEDHDDETSHLLESPSSEIRYKATPVYRKAVAGCLAYGS